MLSETITIPKTISEGEDRFVIKLKENLLRIIKEVNKNSKKIGEVKEEAEEEIDYTEEFNKKANVDASNIGYGDLFLEIKDDEGEVIYSEQDNREDWGKALTDSSNKISSDNVTLVSSQNVYSETHPYMEKDGDQWINPYHYINYKTVMHDSDIENINKQDRYGKGDLPVYEPNDNTVAENLVNLDTAIYELSLQLDDKANISLNNINHNGELVINDIAKKSVFVQDDRWISPNSSPDIRVERYKRNNTQTGLPTYVYRVFSVLLIDGDETINVHRDYPDNPNDLIIGVNIARNNQFYISSAGIELEFGDIRNYPVSESDQAISGQKVYDEVKLPTDLNLNHISTLNTTGENIWALDTYLKSLEDRVDRLENPNSSS